MKLEGFDEAVEKSKKNLILSSAGNALGGIQSNLDALGVTDLRAFRQSLRTGADLAPLDRLKATQEEFGDIRARA
ncbi:MAG: hypothetical protein ACREVH_12430, partial [Gammaproteobacteria bacterium]